VGMANFSVDLLSSLTISPFIASRFNLFGFLIFHTDN